MWHLVCFALLLASAAADSEPAEGHVSEYHEHHEHHDNDRLYLKAKFEGHHPAGPKIARNLHNGQDADIEKQDEIIRDTYAPDYYEPLWVLDYRYLKSGGRKYTRGPGGQVLILPRSYKPQPGDDVKDYDSMIERLRHKRMAEERERSKGHSHRSKYDHHHHHHDDY